MTENHIYSPLPPWQRTDYCGTLRAADAGREAALWGWVAARRDHGGLIFIDLRDREGLVQLVFNPEHDKAAHEVAGDARAEYFMAVKGKVIRRSEGTINAELPTGEIEVVVTDARILNDSEPPPFPLTDGSAAEDVRLRFRYLDLRRPEMQRNLRRRHLAVQAARAYLDVYRAALGRRRRLALAHEQHQGRDEHGHGDEGRRVVEDIGQVGRVVKLMLFKAFYLYCLQARIDWIVIAARAPLDRHYSALLFEDLLEGGGFIPLRHACDIPHRVMALQVPTAEARHLA